MDNVEHAFAVQQLRKSGKNAKIVSIFCANLVELSTALDTCLVFEPRAPPPPRPLPPLHHIPLVLQTGSL